MGVATDIDLDGLVDVGRDVARMLEVPLAAYATTGGTKAVEQE